MINTVTDVGAYILGLLWGTMAEGAKEGFRVRHQDRWYVDAIKNHCDIKANDIYAKQERTGIQYQLRISKGEAEPIRELLEIQGWKPRQAKERAYPSGSLNDRGFCRAWIELHHSLGFQIMRTKNNEYTQNRLRVYGNLELLEEMNYIISAATGLRHRSIQNFPGTKCIGFWGISITKLCSWLYDGAKIWNPTVRANLETEMEV